MPLFMPPSFVSKFTDQEIDLDKFLDSASCMKEQATEFLRWQKPDVDKIPLEDLGPKDGLLYVHQGEAALSNPEDPDIKYLASSDATTCHVVIMRNPTTGMCGVIHVDMLYESSMDDFASKIGDDNIDLYLVGGFVDERRLSELLSKDLLEFFRDSELNFRLKLCCIGKFNTLEKRTCSSINPYNVPLAYGAAINVQTGEVFRARFPERGPDENLRHARLCYGRSRGSYVEPYDCRTGRLTVDCFDISKVNNITYLQSWLSVPDWHFLSVMSTSPRVEPPHFCYVSRSALKLVIENYPKMEESPHFPNGRPRIWKLLSGKWTRVHE